MPTGYGNSRGRLLAVLAVLLALAGAALLGLGLRGLATQAGPALAAPVQEDRVDVGPDGFSLWSPDATAYRTAVCAADGTTLLRPVADYAISVDGTTYHELARSPASLAEGEQQVSCTPAQEFRVGPHAGATSRTGIQGTTGVLLGAALLALAVVLGAWTLVATVRRRRLEAFRVPARRLDPGLARRDPGEG